MNNNIFCFYHANCADGFTSAWIVNNFYKNHGIKVTLIPCFYGNPIDKYYEICKDALVYIVDFSFPVDIMKDLCEYAERVVLIDHHKTAQENLVGKFSHPRLELSFDMGRSGAGLVWDFMYPGTDRPLFVDYVEDRDLWKFRLAHSKQAAEIYFSKEYSIENWDRLCDMFEQDTHEWINIAYGIQEYKEKSYKEMCEAGAFFVKINTYPAILCNLPYMWGSDACNYLCQQHRERIDFAAYYWDSEGYRNFGLRSVGEFDVSAVAKSFGGGGHKNAAGFRIEIKEAETLTAAWKEAAGRLV